MKPLMIISAALLAGLLMASTGAQAQLPGGMQMPGSLALPSKDSLLKQAQELVSDLTSMKESSKLTPPQAKQAGDLLPKAQSLTSELELGTLCLRAIRYQVGRCL
jgi:hypothetical protein